MCFTFYYFGFMLKLLEHLLYQAAKLKFRTEIQVRKSVNLLVIRINKSFNFEMVTFCMI